MTTRSKPVKRYRVLVGINWPDGKGGERRAEPGDLITDKDLKTAKNPGWFAEIGAIRLEGGEG